MKKFSAFLAVVMILAILVSMVACTANFKPLDTAPDGAVENNGTMAVKCGDYVFAVNSTSGVSADNNYGTPVLGSIIRLDYDESSDTLSNPQIVVPKIFYSTNKNCGFYIIDGRIYFVSPSLTKNKKNVRLYEHLDVFSCKTDGSDVKTIKEGIPSNAILYRFAKVDGTVYMGYFLNGSIYSVNTNTGKTTVIDTDVKAAVFGNTDDDGYVYYTKDVKKEKNPSELEDFNEFRKVLLNNTDSQLIVDKNGKELTYDYLPKYVGVEDDTVYGKDGYKLTKDCKVSPLMVDNGTVFYSKISSVDTSVEICEVSALSPDGKIVVYTYSTKFSSIQPISIDKGIIAKIVITEASTNENGEEVAEESKLYLIDNGCDILSLSKDDDISDSFVEPSLIINYPIDYVGVYENGETVKILYFNGEDKIVGIDYKPGASGDRPEIRYTYASAVSDFLRPAILLGRVFFFNSDDPTFSGYLNATKINDDNDVEDSATDVLIGKLTADAQELYDNINK